MGENLTERFAELPALLAGHLTLSLSALFVGVAISVPLGVVAARSPRLGGPLLGAASLIQTIPSLALLALMVPILGGTIGFAPAFIALTLYSVLPVLRNTATGLMEVDPAMTEAARGVGMTERQQLWQVELPLALPIIIAGIRTATVWVVGIATLSTPVGAPSLGNYIFAGLQTRNWVSVIFGCVFAAALAIALDQLVRMYEVSARDRKPGYAWAATIGLVAIVAVGLGPVAYGSMRNVNYTNVAGSGPVGLERSAAVNPLLGQDVKIGSKTFTEQYILADLIERHLTANGARVSNLQNMGSTILFDALRNDTVDVYVDYTGTIWATIMNRKEPIERTAMYIEIAHYLRSEFGILTVGRLGFENAYGLAMRRDQAQAIGASSIEHLAQRAADLSIGGDPEFFSRAEWIRVRDAYGLGAMRTRSMDSTFMYGAVRDGEVNVISAYTTDGRIAAFDLIILRDPKQAFPPYDAIILVSPWRGEKAWIAIPRCRA